MTDYLTPAIRKWVYGIATAVIPLLIVYGVLDENAAPLWIALVGAVLVPGMAALHTDTRTETGMPEHAYEDENADS